MINKKFGRLKVISILKCDGKLFADCVCDCGKKVCVYKNSLTLGHTKSCGCLRSENSSKRMKKRNPMHMVGIKEKMIKTLRDIGHRPLIRGGNGKEMPLPQKLLLIGLGKGWFGEHTVPTNLKRVTGGYPTCYKIDIANPKFKIGIEVDGGYPTLLSRQQQDKKKTLFLEGLGWTIYRYKNKEVLDNLENIIKKFNDNSI